MHDMPLLITWLVGLFTLVISVLCLLIQILVYIWIEELAVVKAVIAVVGVIGMLPLLHFLPIPRSAWEKDENEVNAPRDLEQGHRMAQSPVTGPLHPIITTSRMSGLPLSAVTNSPVSGRPLSVVITPALPGPNPS
jgi:hypothetical protein